MAAGTPPPEHAGAEPGPGPGAGPDPRATESTVRVPVRRTPVTPVPVGVRKGGQGGPVRAWTPVGTVDAGILGEVDAAGMVHMAGAPWSLDWWVGAEDRWHHPGMEAAVRQGPLDASPVRQSALRVPGGEVVQRVGGVQATAGPWSGPAVVVELENLSAVPVALALVVRPWRLDGPGAIGRVALDGAGGGAAAGAVLAVDGQARVLLDRMPSRVVHGPTAEVAARLAAGEDAEPQPNDAWAAGGGEDLEVAFVVPLAHTATVRVLLPATGTGPRRRWPRRRGDAAPAPPWSAPDLGAVARGWSVHGRTDPRLSAPVDAWSDLVGWSANMLRLAGPQEVTDALDRTAARPAGPDSGARLAAVAEALAGLDASELNDAVAAALVGAQRFSGAVEPADGSDATAALLWSAGAVLGSPLGPARAEDLVGPAAKAVRHLATRWSPDAPGVGPAGGLRLAAALRALAGGLAAVDQPEVARDALTLAGRVADPAARPGGPAGEGRPASTFAAARADRDAVALGSVGGIEQLVERVPVRRGDGLADAPGEGCLGFDVAELAETRLALLDAMVGDGPAGPVLLPSWPREWHGRPVEAHDVRTAWGLVSFALRWHGSRPALLWEVTPRLGTTEGRSAPEVRAPGLDPAFAAAGWSGEALLADPADRGAAGLRGGARPPGEGDSFG